MPNLTFLATNRKLQSMSERIEEIRAKMGAGVLILTLREIFDLPIEDHTPKAEIDIQTGDNNPEPTPQSK